MVTIGEAYRIILRNGKSPSGVAMGKELIYLFNVYKKTTPIPSLGKEGHISERVPARMDRLGRARVYLGVAFKSAPPLRGFVCRKRRGWGGFLIRLFFYPY